MGFEDDLKARRASVVVGIAELRESISALEGVLSSFDGLIRFYDPSAAFHSRRKKRKHAFVSIDVQIWL